MRTVITIIDLFAKPHQFFNFNPFKMHGDCKLSSKYALANRVVNALALYGLLGVYLFLAFLKH